MPDIRQLIQRGKTAQAIESLIALVGSQQRDLETQLLLLSSRLTNIERSRNQHQVTLDEWERVINQINQATLYVLYEAENLNLEKASAEQAVVQTRKILFFGANPTDTPRINIDIESRELHQIFRTHPNSDQVIFLKEFATTLPVFRDVALAEKPNLIHFAIYANEEGLYLHGPDDNHIIVPNANVSLVFELFDFPLECVFFNTWISAELARSLQHKVPYVIGMNGLIIDQASIIFATGFYQALAYGKSVPEAFALGKRLLVIEDYASEAEKPFLIDKED